MTSELLNEIALAIDAFITLRVERDTLASELTQDELSEMALGILEITARHRLEERAKIVAWLRSNNMSGRWSVLADEIENGEHLK